MPVATEAGDTFAVEVDSARPAALFRRIPGEHLDDDDIDGVQNAAAAFASLDVALAAIDRTDVPSIFGAGGLNFCVRDGNRCDPAARRTEGSILARGAAAGQETQKPSDGGRADARRQMVNEEDEAKFR